MVAKPSCSDGNLMLMSNKGPFPMGLSATLLGSPAFLGALPNQKSNKKTDGYREEISSL